MAMRLILALNGFEFDDITGELLFAPSNPSLDNLVDTRDKLFNNGEYIKATRITQLINASYLFNNNVYEWDDAFYPTNCETYVRG